MHSVKINIRQEQPADYSEVFNLTKAAFNDLEFASHDEHFLVERLRKSDSFIPELSLVAESNSKIVGHILLTKLKIVDEEKEYESLSLAPVSVLQEYQKQGIGTSLINRAHTIAKQMGYRSVILVGHPDYYPKFGYLKASGFNLKFTFEAPEEVCMALELVENGLIGIKGMVVYPPEFNLHEN